MHMHSSKASGYSVCSREFSYQHTPVLLVAGNRHHVCLHSPVSPELWDVLGKFPHQHLLVSLGSGSDFVCVLSPMATVHFGLLWRIPVMVPAGSSSWPVVSPICMFSCGAQGSCLGSIHPQIHVSSL